MRELLRRGINLGVGLNCLLIREGYLSSGGD